MYTTKIKLELVSITSFVYYVAHTDRAMAEAWNI